MSFLDKFNRLLRKFEEFIIAYGVLGMGALTILNVISRNFFNHGLSFAQEINEFLIVFITFLGTSYAARNGRHIRMSALYDILNKKAKKFLTYIMTFGTSAILFYMTYLSYQYVVRVYLYQRLSPVLRVPLYLIWMWVPIGLLLAAIQYGLAFFKNVVEEDVWISYEEKSEYEDVQDVIDGDKKLEYTADSTNS